MPYIRGRYYTEREIEAAMDELSPLERDRIRSEIKESSSSGGLASFAISTAIGAATGSALLGGIVGGDILGGIAGDLLEGGGLFD